MDVANWQDSDDGTADSAGPMAESIESADPQLEAFRRQLEGLL